MTDVPNSQSINTDLNQRQSETKNPQQTRPICRSDSVFAFFQHFIHVCNQIKL
jgi:hypothetical protein